jgi:serine/threonine protein kinase
LYTDGHSNNDEHGGSFGDNKECPMIATLCVHCGQRMKVKEDDTSKAQCPKCGHVVTIAGARPGRRGRGPTGSKSGEQTTALPAPVPEPTRLTPAGEQATGSLQPMQEIATRSETSPLNRSLTDLLSPPQSPDEIGRLGPYRVLEVVGAGGMGVVYKAEDPQLRRVVAVKAMLPALAANETARKRFLQEAQAAAGIQHDHIVAIYHVGEDHGVPFLVMPFLKGESLDTRLRKTGGPLPVPEVLRIGEQIAEGLAAIHDLGLIHRDIKPGNVWLEGEAARVKILDFGLARVATGDAQLTQEGSILGSPAFMAPEQANRKVLDARCDLFGLGCVLYLISTNALPFEGEDALTTLVAVTCADPVPPHERNSQVPVAVSRLILSLLEKKPADRPANARAVIGAIRKLAR